MSEGYYEICSVCHPNREKTDDGIPYTNNLCDYHRKLLKEKTNNEQARKNYS